MQEMCKKCARNKLQKIWFLGIFSQAGDNTRIQRRNGRANRIYTIQLIPDKTPLQEEHYMAICLMVLAAISCLVIAYQVASHSRHHQPRQAVKKQS